MEGPLVLHRFVALPKGGLRGRRLKPGAVGSASSFGAGLDRGSLCKLEDGPGLGDTSRSNWACGATALPSACAHRSRRALVIPGAASFPVGLADRSQLPPEHVHA